jgi:hypothetical protein
MSGSSRDRRRAASRLTTGTVALAWPIWPRARNLHRTRMFDRGLEVRARDLIGRRQMPAATFHLCRARCESRRMDAPTRFVRDDDAQGPGRCPPSLGSSAETPCPIGAAHERGRQGAPGVHAVAADHGVRYRVLTSNPRVSREKSRLRVAWRSSFFLCTQEVTGSNPVGSIPKRPANRQIPYTDRAGLRTGQTVRPSIIRRLSPRRAAQMASSALMRGWSSSSSMTCP